jgi:lysophospholipase L1-like esterase
MIKMKVFKVILCGVFCVITSFNVNAQVVINAGVGGNATTNILKRLEKDVLNKNPDFVILMVGTNDMLNSKKMISYTSYRKNMKTIVDKIKKSGSDVLLMSSPPADSVYLFERHNKIMFKESPNEKLNKTRAIVSKIATDNQLYFLDVYQAFVNLNLPKHNKDLFFRNAMNSGASDGVHPTVLGYHFIAELVFQYLKKNHLLQAYNKIICLGDSITNGSGVKNKEQAYPGVLQSLIVANIKT